MRTATLAAPEPSTLPLPSFACGAAASSASASASASVPTAPSTDAQLGLLVWHFFMTWAVEFPYRKRVVSLREPHALTKSQQGWR